MLSSVLFWILSRWDRVSVDSVDLVFRISFWCSYPVPCRAQLGFIPSIHLSNTCRMWELMNACEEIRLFHSIFMTHVICASGKIWLGRFSDQYPVDMKWDDALCYIEKKEGTTLLNQEKYFLSSLSNVRF